MSSSMSGQWMPVPGPTKRQFPRCAGVASRSLGNRENGVLISRPSSRDTTRAPSVNWTSRARASGGLFTQSTGQAEEPGHGQILVEIRPVDGDAFADDLVVFELRHGGVSGRRVPPKRDDERATVPETDHKLVLLKLDSESSRPCRMTSDRNTHTRAPGKRPRVPGRVRACAATRPKSESNRSRSSRRRRPSGRERGAARLHRSLLEEHGVD